MICSSIEGIISVTSGVGVGVIIGASTELDGDIDGDGVISTTMEEDCPRASVATLRRINNL